MRTRRWPRMLVIAGGGLVAFGAAWGQFSTEPKEYGKYFEEEKPWVEAAVALPEYPKPASLIELYVDAATPNKFFVDANSLSIAEDGVVRYTAVVKTPGGAVNVSFEGMRCKTKERRLYAFGRPDNSWAKARGNEWVGIRAGGSAGYQAVLYKEYFCPGGVAIHKVEEGVDALKRGGHPSAIR